MPFNEGDRVRLKTPVIEGPVSDIQFDKGARELAYEVTYTDVDGHEQVRFFPESALELVEPAPSDAAPVAPASDPAPTTQQEA